MYIDTHSRDSMEKSMCEIFHMQPVELYDRLRTIYIFENDDDDFKLKLDEFIEERTTGYPDEILFFHLSRRLYEAEDETECCNLKALLLSENSFSLFTKKYEIDFVEGEHHIEVYYKGEIVDWDKCESGNPSYMKSRLGYFAGEEDFCVNGFAMKDLLYRNDYARDLLWAPEFLRELADCLQCRGLESEYMEKSDYFCYEYRLPLSNVIFDGCDDYSDREKQRHLFERVLKRLYQYTTTDSDFCLSNDIENPVLRLKDDEIIPSEFCVGKELINDGLIFGGYSI